MEGDGGRSRSHHSMCSEGTAVRVGPHSYSFSSMRTVWFAYVGAGPFENPWAKKNAQLRWTGCWYLGTLGSEASDVADWLAQSVGDAESQRVHDRSGTLVIMVREMLFSAFVGKRVTAAGEHSHNHEAIIHMAGSECFVFMGILHPVRMRGPHVCVCVESRGFHDSLPREQARRLTL